jgi:hypothetical protein
MYRFMTSGGDPEAVVRVARNLALAFSKEHNDPKLAYHVLDWAMQRVGTKISPTTKAAYDLEAANLFRDWKLNEISQHENNVSHAITIVEDALRTAPPRVAGEFSAMLPELYKKKREGGLVFIAACAIGFIFFVGILSIK